MSDKLAKAQLRQLDSPDPTVSREIEPETWCTVQFNPESLKVTFANEVLKPPGAGDQRGSPALQFVGTSTTKLTLTLWFDVGSPQPPGGAAVGDVRKLTQKVAYFIKPKEVSGSKKRPKQLPVVRFLWGSFQFDGVVESLEETLEFFSPEGEPLRASVALSLAQQDFQFAFRDLDGAGAAAGSLAAGATPGTQPLAQAAEGATVQELADSAGRDDWQSIAAANGIENPRLLTPGQLLDFNATRIPARLGL